MVINAHPKDALTASSCCFFCTILLHLSGRRNNVSAAEMEEFNKQVQCLNLPPPAVLDPEKGMVPWCRTFNC